MHYYQIMAKTVMQLHTVHLLILLTIRRLSIDNFLIGFGKIPRLLLVRLRGGSVPTRGYASARELRRCQTFTKFLKFQFLPPPKKHLGINDSVDSLHTKLTKDSTIGPQYCWLKLG